MKYLCLCYYNEQQFNAMSKERLDEMIAVCQPHDEELRATGRVFAQASLSDPGAAAIIRSDNGKPSVSGGRYAESKEPIGAFFIVEARDLNEAVLIASKHPGPYLGDFLGGAIEVRACDTFEPA